jgi:uncharacterized protein (TIGR02646 family)
MIRIVKPENPPNILLTRGEAETRENCRKFDAGETISFKTSIYRHVTVLMALERAQHEKCCFCELLIGSDSDVEHFRPKAKVYESPDHLGYYWLAYDWENLLLTCPACNSRYKKTRFPLLDETKRALSHHDAITDEEPVLLHPVRDNLEEHIAFREDMIHGLTERGRQTIEILGLARPRRGVCRQRQKQYTLLMRVLNDWHDAKKENDTVNEAKAQFILELYLREDAQFLAMTRTTLQTAGYLVA